MYLFLLHQPQLHQLQLHLVLLLHLRLPQILLLRLLQAVSLQLLKRCALSKFRLKTKTDKKTTCPSCKQDTHARLTSNPCPNKKVKRDIPRNDDEKIENFTIKCSLKKTCRDARIIKSINKLVGYATMVIHVGSLFANYIIFKLAEVDGDMPIIDHNFTNAILSVLSGNGEKRPVLFNNILMNLKRHATWTRKSLNRSIQ